ncbi:MAG: hypothetical protein EOO39_23805, partial [Cytophagaceae bacterium]
MKKMYLTRANWLIAFIAILGLCSSSAWAQTITNVTFTPSSICPGSDVNVSFAASSFTSPPTNRNFSVEISTLANFTSSVQIGVAPFPSTTGGGTITANIPIGQAAGNYYVRVKQANVSSSASSTQLTVKAIPATPIVSVVDNCGNSTLSTAASGTLLWSTAANTPSITVNTAGVYTVTTTANGCISQAGQGTAAPKSTPAAPTANNASLTYDNAAHTATATAPSGGSVLYYTASTLGTATSAPTATDAGTYSVWAESLNNGCASTTRTQVTLTINKATPTISLVVGGPYPYDGTAKSVTSAVVNGVSGPIGAATLAYSPAAAPVNAGSYNVTADYAETANYVAATQQTGTLAINKAVATVTVTGYTGTYDGAAHGATGTATGVGGSVGTLDLGASFTDVPGGTANWTFTGGANYTDQNGSVAITINKAAATLALSNLTYTYDGTAKTATVTTTPSGLAGVSLIGGGQTNAGTYPLTASLTNPNYTAADATADLVISKATAIVTVSGYTGTYDGAAHGATGTATGVGSTDLSGSLNLGSSFTDAPGGTANWTFTGGTNYTDQSGSVAITINKATASVNVSGYTG